MLDDAQLNDYRLNGTLVRVIRDCLESNDVTGRVVAWDNDKVMIRRPNRKVVLLKRSYHIQPKSEERVMPDFL